MAAERGKGDLVVVGVDGSDSSEQALRWAVRQAELTGGRVDAVSAWDFPRMGAARAWAPPTGSAADNLEQQAQKDIEDAVEKAVGPGPTVPVRAAARYGTPAGVLLDAARDAALLVLLVVGSRGRGGFKGLLLGSVAQQITQRAACPVVVVHGPAQ